MGTLAREMMRGGFAVCFCHYALRVRYLEPLDLLDNVCIQWSHIM